MRRRQGGGMKPFKIFAWIALVSGLLVTWLFGGMALEDNHQGEFRDQVTGVMHWDVFIPLIGLSFAYMAGLVFGILSLGLVAFRLIKTVVPIGRC
jgi:hypothetical protein